MIIKNDDHLPSNDRNMMKENLTANVETAPPIPTAMKQTGTIIVAQIGRTRTIQVAAGTRILDRVTEDADATTLTSHSCFQSNWSLDAEGMNSWMVTEGSTEESEASLP